MRVCSVVTALLAIGLAAAGQDPKPAAREIPTQNLKLTFPANPGKPTVPGVIASADELAKHEVVGAAVGELKKQVDFTKEKLLVFAWAGSGQDRVSVGITTAGDKKVLSIAFLPGKTFDLREHIRLYVVPNEVVVGAADGKPALRTLELKGVKLVFPDQLIEPKPIEITSAEELAKAKGFADDASREAVKKQVDFAKEKLVVFIWAGSGGDKLTGELKMVDKKSVAVFTYKPGITDDFVHHSRMFAVPKDAGVEVKK